MRKLADLIFLIYNKLADKVCYNPDLVDYVNLLDDMIYDIFIKKCSDDLQSLAEYCTCNEFSKLNKEKDSQVNIQ